MKNGEGRLFTLGYGKVLTEEQYEDMKNNPAKSIRSESTGNSLAGSSYKAE